MNKKKMIKVLVVDDQDNWRRALRTLLESEGFCVSEASEFEDAQVLIPEYKFDVIILDLRLVDRDVYNVEGLELLHLARSVNPETRVVMLTGYPESLHKKPNDVDAFILKVPNNSTFDNAEFKAIVREFAQELENKKDEDV